MESAESLRFFLYDFTEVVSIREHDVSFGGGDFSNGGAC